MIICIDVGNTTILFGTYDNDKLIDTYRMETKIMKTSDEYGSSLLAHFQINNINKKGIKGAIISSVVPSVDHSLEKIIYDGFMHEAYELGFMPEILSWKANSVYTLESALNGTDADLMHGICSEIRSDYGCNGSLVYNAIANGSLYRLMSAYLSYMQNPQYTHQTISLKRSLLFQDVSSFQSKMHIQ